MVIWCVQTVMTVECSCCIITIWHSYSGTTPVYSYTTAPQHHSRTGPGHCCCAAVVPAAFTSWCCARAAACAVVLYNTHVQLAAVNSTTADVGGRCTSTAAVVLYSTSQHSYCSTLVLLHGNSGVTSHCPPCVSKYWCVLANIFFCENISRQC